MITKYYLIIVFFALALIHIYWAFGGIYGLKSSIPSNNNGPVFEIKFAGTMFIAIIFITGLMAIIFDTNSFQILYIQKYLYHLIFIVFTARVIGDFKYVGLFKKYRHTAFAKYDNVIYSPLCLSISISAIASIIFGSNVTT